MYCVLLLLFFVFRFSPLVPLAHFFITSVMSAGPGAENVVADDGLDMNELFGSSDDDAGGADDAGEKQGEKQEEKQANDMAIPTPLHDALPPSRNHMAKLPPSVRIVPEAFREEAFEGDLRDGVDGVDKIDVRWRYGLDDRTSKLVRESNARIVTWSDGSRTLHVGGNDAVYQMKAVDISKDETYLYTSHARLIQCQGKLRDKLMFNPVSVKQAARPRNQSSRSVKSIKVKQTATLVDPVKEREAKERSEEARIREKEKLVEKQKQMERNAILKDPKFARRSYHGTRGLSAAFLEEDDEEGGRRAANEEEYDEDDGWLLGDDEEGVEEEEVVGDEAGVGSDLDVGDVADGTMQFNQRIMPGQDAEQRNEAALVGIMVDGKATDEGNAGEPKKKRKVISSDSDDDE